MKPQNPAERMLYHAMVWTWPFYAVGALYVVGPVLAWVLGGLAALSLYLGPAMRADLRETAPVHPVIWLWFIGMAVMLIALWVGHLDWDLGLKIPDPNSSLIAIAKLVRTKLSGPLESNMRVKSACSKIIYSCRTTS